MRRMVLSLSIFWMSVGTAADKVEFGPAPSWVKQSEPAPAGKATDAAVKVLLQDQQFKFSPAAVEAYFANVVRIQTPQGLAAMGTISVGWKPDTDVLTVHMLHILRGEQVIDALAAGQTFTILRREDNLEYSALDGVLTAVIQPIGLQVGDTIEMAFSLKRSDPVFAGTSEQPVGGWANASVSRVRVRAHWPTQTPIRWSATAEMKGIKEKRDAEVTEVTLALDDIEPILQPKGAPPRFFVDRRIEFSGFKSWAEVASRLAPHYAKASALAPDSPLRSEIARIKAATPDPRARAAAALVLVQDQVRYVFLGMGDGALVPASADLTWSRRFGDCKGKTTLLLALLHALDIEAEPVAVSTTSGDGLKERLPMIGWFDHVLVRAVIDGRAYWLDGTRIGDRSLERLVTPVFYWGLPLVQNAAELVRILPEPLQQPISTTSVRIDATGGIFLPAPFRAETVLSGIAAVNLNFQLGNLSATDLDRALRSYWSKQYDFVDIQSVSAKFDEQSAEERLTMEGTARMDWDNDRYETDGLWLGYKADFERQSGPNRDAPFAVPYPIYSRVSETILLPYGGAGFSVKGEDIEQTLAGVEYRRRAKIEKGVFSAESSTRSITPEFPAAEAAVAQKTLREMAKSGLYVNAPNKYWLNEKELAAELAKTYDDADDYVDRGNMLLDRGDYERAIAAFDKALALDPKDDMALADRGITRAHQGKIELARKDLDAAFAMNPRNPVVFRGRGLIAFNAREFTEAISAFTTSLQLNRDNVFSLGKRARSYWEVGDEAKALADSAEAIRLSPRFKEMYLFRASIFIKKGKTEDAIAEAKAVVAADPENAYAYTIAGDIYSRIKKDAEAMQAFDRAVEIAQTETAYLTRARYRAKEDRTGRRADIEAALQLNPKSQEALGLKATFEIETGEYSSAIATLNELLAEDGNNVSALTARGFAYAKAGQTELAEKDFESGRAKASSPTELNNICWDMAITAVALPKALEICDAALEKAPDSPVVLDSRGFVLLRLGRYDEAIAAYDAALKKHPAQAMSRYGRGVAKRRKGDPTGGDADIKEALSVSADVDDEFASYGVTP